MAGLVKQSSRADLSGKHLTQIGKCLELKDIPAGIEEEHGSLFAHLRILMNPALLFLFQFQRRRVNAIPQARRLRTIRKNMAEMGVALAAHDFRAAHE